MVLVGSVIHWKRLREGEEIHLDTKPLDGFTKTKHSHIPTTDINALPVPAVVNSARLASRPHQHETDASAGKMAARSLLFPGCDMRLGSLLLFNLRRNKIKKWDGRGVGRVNGSDCVKIETSDLGAS